MEAIDVWDMFSEKMIGWKFTSDETRTWTHRLFSGLIKREWTLELRAASLTLEFRALCWSLLVKSAALWPLMKHDTAARYWNLVGWLKLWFSFLHLVRSAAFFIFVNTEDFFWQALVSIHIGCRREEMLSLYHLWKSQLGSYFCVASVSDGSAISSACGCLTTASVLSPGVAGKFSISCFLLYKLCDLKFVPCLVDPPTVTLLLSGHPPTSLSVPLSFFFLRQGLPPAPAFLVLAV